MLIVGKSTSNSKEVICPDDKYKEEGDLWNVEAQTAFLGPNLWEKTLPYDADLKVTQVSIIIIARHVVLTYIQTFTTKQQTTATKTNSIESRSSFQSRFHLLSLQILNLVQSHLFLILSIVIPLWCNYLVLGLTCVLVWFVSQFSSLLTSHPY